MLNRVTMAALAVAVLTACASPGPPTIQTLHAQAAFPPQAEQMAAFGRLIGDWDIIVEFRQEDGSWIQAEGEWHFGWILQGRAVQDVWTVYRPGADRSAPDAILGYGTTVRVYDASADAWHVNWMGVHNHNYTRFLARNTGEELVMDAVGEEGDPFQWIFSDITPNSFRWRAQSFSNGAWDVPQRMSAVRRERRR